MRPSPCCPRHRVRLPCEPQRRCGRRVRHAHCLRVHASCRLGGFAKWRGNVGSDSELPYDQNRGALGLRLCVLSLSHSHSHSLRNLSDSPSTQPNARFVPSLSTLALPLLLLSPLLRLRLRLLFLFILSSSSLCFLPPLLLHLRFFFWVSFFLVVVVFSFVSALANPCWLKPLWLPAQLLGGVDVGCRTKELSSNVACASCVAGPGFGTVAWIEAQESFGALQSETAHLVVENILMMMCQLCSKPNKQRMQQMLT